MYQKYLNYWTEKSNNAQQYTSEIKMVFKKANIEDKRIGYAEPIGFGQIRTGAANIMDNLFTNNNNFFAGNCQLFNDAIGTFRRRIFENFSPVFWIESLIFLPKNVFQYLGVKADSIFIKIFQILYWLIGVLYTIYSNQINSLIQDFLSNFFK